MAVVGVQAGGSLAGKESREASSTTSIDGLGVAGLSQPALSRSNMFQLLYDRVPLRGTGFTVTKYTVATWVPKAARSVGEGDTGCPTGSVSDGVASAVTRFAGFAGHSGVR